MYRCLACILCKRILVCFIMPFCIEILQLFVKLSFSDWLFHRHVVGNFACKLLSAIFYRIWNPFHGSFRFLKIWWRTQSLTFSTAIRSTKQYGGFYVILSYIGLCKSNTSFVLHEGRKSVTKDQLEQNHRSLLLEWKRSIWSPHILQVLERSLKMVYLMVIVIVRYCICPSNF